MPITVVCDDCSKSHKVRDDAVGKRFPCKGCGKSLKIEVPILEVDDVEEVVDLDDAEEDELDELDDYAPAPRRSPPKRSKSGGRKTSSGRKSGRSSVSMGQTFVPLGITLVYFGFMAFIVVFLIAFLIGLAAQRDIFRYITLLQILSYVAMGAAILTSAGKLLCLTAPHRMSGKIFIVLATLIDLSAIGLNILSRFQPLPHFLIAIINLLTVAGAVCFVLFLKELGHFLKEPDISERATGVLTIGATVVGLWLGIICLGVLGFSPIVNRVLLGIVVLIFALSALIAGILGILRYAGLLSACSYALERCD